MRRILAEQRIIARDQNKVFVERASARRLSPHDVEERYDLLGGKGNACVEFDIEPELLMSQYNKRLRRSELCIAGDVALVGRNACGFLNR